MNTDWYPTAPKSLGKCEGECDGARAKHRVRRADGSIELLCDACAAGILGVPTDALGDNKVATATTDHYGGLE